VKRGLATVPAADGVTVVSAALVSAVPVAMVVPEGKAHSSVAMGSVPSVPQLTLQDELAPGRDGEGRRREVGVVGVGCPPAWALPAQPNVKTMEMSRRRRAERYMGRPRTPHQG
jgi:hypothetical protein